MLPHVTEYLAYLAASDCQATTLRDYRLKLRQFGAWLEGTGSAYTQESLTGYRDHCQQALGHRPRTLRLTWCALRAYTKWLRELHPGDWPRPELTRLPRLDPAQRVCPGDREIDALFTAARRLPAHTPLARRHRGRALALLTLFAYAGLRRSEALSLEVRDLRAGKPWLVHVRCGKGRQVRLVPVCAGEGELLPEWLALRADWCRERGITTGNLFLVDRRRPRLSHEGLEQQWRELIHLAGLEGSGITPHCLRHWFGTSVAAAEGWETASEMLGHADLATTARYLHTNVERKERAAESLSGRLVSERRPEGTRQPVRDQLPAEEGPARTGDGRRFRRQVRGSRCTAACSRRGRENGPRRAPPAS